MRDIKFRAKSIHPDGEWKFGSLKRYIDHGKVSIMEEVEGGHMWLIDPATVGQHTGLKDKNGKEIYEGDVYLADRSYMPSRGHLRKGYPERIKVICVVEWSVYDAGWRDREIGPIEEHKEFDKHTPYHYYHTSLSGSQDGNAEWMEVIGNIHDNPELIKQK